MSWWQIALAVWFVGSFPLAALVGKALAFGDSPPRRATARTARPVSPAWDRRSALQR